MTELVGSPMLEAGLEAGVVFWAVFKVPGGSVPGMPCRRVVSSGWGGKRLCNLVMPPESAVIVGLGFRGQGELSGGSWMSELLAIYCHYNFIVGKTRTNQSHWSRRGEDRKGLAPVGANLNTE